MFDGRRFGMLPDMRPVAFATALAAVLSLASGAHYCTGAGLARLEASVATERFLARYPQARLVEDPPPIRDDVRPSLRGYRSLMVDFGL